MEDPASDVYNPDLMTCVGTVPRLVGCEAAYYFPADMDVCAPFNAHGGGGDNSTQEDSESELGRATGSSDVGAEGNRGGHLVLHVRSGDIFGTSAPSGYGQVYIYCAVVHG